MSQNYPFTTLQQNNPCKVVLTDLIAGAVEIIEYIHRYVDSYKDIH